MYLLSRKIKAEGFKVVLSGEGADEVYGGYLFFHKAPSPRHFHECAAQAGTRKQTVSSHLLCNYCLVLPGRWGMPILSARFDPVSQWPAGHKL